MANETTIQQYSAKLTADTIAWMARDISNPEKHISVPEGYDIGTEITTAVYQLTKSNGNGGCLLDRCDKGSVMNALKNMCLLGVSPAKNQCYFIPYGQELQMQISYFGYEAIMSRMYPQYRVAVGVLNEGDKYKLVTNAQKGFVQITEHEKTLESLSAPIAGAYGSIYDKDTGETIYAEVMNREQIETAWKAAKTKNVQNAYPDQMAKRTVMKRMIKRFINSTPQTNSMAQTYNEVTADEYEDDKPVDITPPANDAEVKQRLKGKSQGQEGLKAILSAKKETAEEVKENGEIVEAPEVEEEEETFDDNPYGEYRDDLNDDDLPF